MPYRTGSRGRGSFRRIFPAYMMILLLPILIGGWLFVRSFSILEDEIAKNRIHQLEVARDTVDTFIRELDSLILFIGRDPELGVFSKKQAFSRAAIGYDQFRVARRISTSYLENSLITYLYIYFPKSTIILRNSTVFPGISQFYGRFFTARTLRGADLSLAQWRDETLEGRHYRHFLPSLVYEDNGDPREVLPYVQTLQISGLPSEYVTIVAAIDKERLEDLLRRYLISEVGYAYILDGNLNEIAVTVDTSYTVFRPSMELQFGPYVAKSEEGREPVSVTFVRSRYNDWVFATVLPADVFWARLRNIQRTTFLSMGIIVIAGIVFSFFLARRNTKTISAITTMLRELDTTESRREEREDSFLSGSISDLIRRNESLTSTMDENRPLLRSAFLGRLLRGEFHSLDEIGTLARRVDCRLEGVLFTVVAVRIPGYHGHLSSSELTEFEVKETLVIEIIEKIVDDSTIVYPFTDDEIAVIVQHRNAIEGQLKDAVRTLIENIRREVTHRTNIRVFTGYGGIYNSANLIGQSFTEARNAVEYQRITGTSTVTAVEDMPENQELFHYPPDAELRLLSSIQAGNIENLKAVLEEIGRINIVETTLRPFMLEGLLENLKATLLKGIGSIEGEEEKGRFVAEIKAALEAKRVLSFDELQVSFIRLTRIVNEKRAHHYDDLSAKIREYIDEHYADKDLSLSLIASRFQMTDTYVCKLFKTHTGQSLFGYIQNARMKKAMDMLADYGNTVEGVSLDCGYSNVSTFRRAFKRHTGVSPSDYRVKKLI